MREKINLAVLISGRGSNLKAIIDSIKNGYLDKVNLRVVIANKDAPGLNYAKEAGILYHLVHKIVDGEKIPKEEHDKKVLVILEKYDIDLIALAGYDQVLQKEFVKRYEWKIMNIHPSLLPSFGGTLHGQKDALDYGAKISGCTVHFIEEGVDTGPIIIQAAVPVKDDDTSETLADRILESPKNRWKESNCGRGTKNFFYN
jgi:phosphoribosylglycinamide formyltransferase-1